ncbi:MAG: DOMON-like domain-containing protein [Cyanobacteria bacterium P01_A01_bin.83]
MKSFSLVPFASKIKIDPAIKITGKITRQNNLLNLKYTLDGTAKIVIPPPVASPTRQYNLWQHTCFEFFLGLKDSTKYWEFNLAPDRSWNVFYLSNYRQDLAQELAFKTLPFKILPQQDTLQLDLKIDLTKIVSAQQFLEVGITTVIEDQQQQLSYWALNHPGQQADFHCRDSFLIDL